MLVSESNSGQGFRCSWTELSSWVDWIERQCNSESLGREAFSATYDTAFYKLLFN